MMTERGRIYNHHGLSVYYYNEKKRMCWDYFFFAKQELDILLNMKRILMNQFFILCERIHNMDYFEADFIVVGTGIAGMSVALSLAMSGNVIIITKAELEKSNSFHAQGGIAAALSEQDSPELHLQDTLRTGVEHCDPNSATLLVNKAPETIRRLAKWGTHFDRNGTQWALGHEGSHSMSRILHVQGDATGKGITLSLKKQVLKQPNIKVFMHTEVFDLAIENGECVGIYANKVKHGQQFFAARKGVVLATGGAGQLYQYTTNDSVATGDGFAIAYRAGAQLVDMEFIQFHPTALNVEQNPMFLISEAVRGEGAVLVNDQGEAFMSRYHSWGDLAPRDVVSRAIYQQQMAGHAIYLDARKLKHTFATRFPTIYARCLQYGFHPGEELIPVTPAAHFIMGGIKTNIHGETSIPRLFACGEVACTGVHGANRLASNSLLEGAVFAKQVAKKLAQNKAIKLDQPDPLNKKVAVESPANYESWSKTLRQIMWKYAGIVRTAEGLQTGLQMIEQLHPPDDICRNMWITAQLILQSASRRQESRGGHYRLDYPETQQEWVKKHIVIGV